VWLKVRRSDFLRVPNLPDVAHYTSAIALVVRSNHNDGEVADLIGGESWFVCRG
jgi:hypothetical protein